MPDKTSRYFQIALIAVFFSATACKSRTESGSDVKYYALDSKQARMTFDMEFEANLTNGNLTEADKAIAEHIEFVIGALKEHPGRKDAPGVISMAPSFDRRAGTPKSGPDFIRKSVTSGSGGFYTIAYSFDRTAVFKNKIADNQSSIEIVLPRNYKQAYIKGMVDISEALELYADDRWATDDINKHQAHGNTQINLCTDLHYNSEGDFWYFWNPFRKGCPLGAADLVKQTAKLEVLPNTVLTFPEYGKFPVEHGKKKLDILFIRSLNASLTDASDSGRLAYESALGLFASAGFKKIENDPNYTSWTFENDYVIAKLETRFMDNRSADFAKLVATRIPEVDIFVYAGHSGLGGTLPISKMDRYASNGKFTLPENKYQVLYFNGCSSYAYYNQNYFDLKKSESDKKGTKFLDIVTNGRSSSQSLSAPTSVYLITDLISKDQPSWQQIMDRLYKNSASSPAISQINGDEDNPQKNEY